MSLCVRGTNTGHYILCARTRSLPLIVQTPCCTIPNSPTPSCLLMVMASAGMICLLEGGALPNDSSIGALFVKLSEFCQLVDVWNCN